jgi:hypothetical protein
MGFMYPRTVSFVRSAAQSGVGVVGYGGHTTATETQIAANIPASVQARREGGTAPNGLPGDGTKPTWYVFIPRSKLAKGTVENRDIMIDDEGERYQVIQPYWDSLGYRLTVITLDP